MTAADGWSAFRNYLGELVDVDDHVGTFVRVLRETGLYDESLVLVVADHGEEFLDHGGRDHGRSLYEEVLRVPGLLKLPGNR
ncbi:MAG: sulfatase-like hydrolase/transferase, partial [Candidatus Binatia bacterium]